MKALFYALAASAAILSTDAQAQDADATEANPISISATVLATTDYMWRGVSQSNNDPSLFAIVNVSSGGFYLGAETEYVNFAGVEQEYDIWGGYVFDLGGAKLDLGFVRYGYIDAPIDIDTYDIKAGLSGNVGRAGLGLTTYYTPDYFGSDNSAIYTEISASHPLTDKLSASGAVGHQQISNAADYTTWNAGVSYAVAPGASVNLRYHDTDTSAFGRLGDSRLVGSFSMTF